jgi:hypothetical protein
MRATRGVLILALGALLGGGAAAPGALCAAEAAEAATAHVTYLAGGSAYVDAGRLDGLVEGDTLRSLADGRVTSLLVVRYLSSRRAVCDTLQAAALPRLGDTVHYVARPVAAASVPPPAAGLPAPGAPAVSAAPGDTSGAAAPGDSTPVIAPRPRTTRTFRGRVGVRWLVVDPSGRGGYSQPGLDLRLDGTRVGGAPVDLSVDVRSQRTYHGTAGIADNGEARVYRFSATVHDESGRRRITVGRQLSGVLASVSMFDGALVEYAGERWGVGVFSGAQPEPLRLQMSGDIVEHGGFVALRGRQGKSRWSLTGGGVASFDHGQVDRQFGFFQGSYLDPRFSISLLEEADLITGWKRGTASPSVSLTSTFASARMQVLPTLSFNAGYDDRRNVRLYRDRETPETEFDDRHRAGGWVGSAIEVANHFRFMTDGRWSGGGTGGAFNSYSVSTEAFRLSSLQAELKWRSTYFDGDLSRGWMHLAGLGARPWGPARIEITAGTRRSEDGLGLIHTRLDWWGTDVDLGIGQRWYLLLSGERDHGDGFSETQGHLSVSRTF